MNNLPPGITQQGIDEQDGFFEPRIYRKKPRMLADTSLARANGWSNEQYHQYQKDQDKYLTTPEML